MLSPQRRRGVAAEWAASAADPVVNAILLADQSRHSCSAAERHAASLQTIRAATLVLGSFLTSPGSEHAHVTGCEALVTLAADSARRVWLRETHIVSGLIDAMARHPSAARVQLAGVTALALLAVDHDHREAIVFAGGVKWIATALRAHPADVKVQQFALGALLQVLAEPEQLEGALSLEAAALAEASLAAFPTHPEIQRLGSRLLQRLATATPISRTVEPESKPTPEVFPITATAASVGDGSHTPQHQRGVLQPGCSTGRARAQAFIDLIRAQSSTAVEGEGGPSPEAQHRYTQIRLRDPSPSHASSVLNGKSTPRSPAQDETTQDESEMKSVGQDEEERVQTVEQNDTGKKPVFTRLQAVVNEANSLGLRPEPRSPSASAMYPPLVPSLKNRGASPAEPQHVVTATKADDAVDVR